ncbi:MAG: DMT family transporter [Alphaproteobacteria bacterium]|nr:DMT family transporter [Alphaproteobacteria bacterium]
MPSSTAHATLIGFTAVLMWGTLSTLVMLSGHLPPFFATGVAFTVAFALCVIFWALRGDSIPRHFKMTLKIWLLGIFGIFGFHFFYFLALQAAPPVEALLLINLWQMMILLFSVPLLQQKISIWHMTGAALGFLGAGVIGYARFDAATGGFSLSAGHAYALACAVIWALFSVLSRKWQADMPKDAVGVFCGATALLCLTCHALLEPAVDATPMQYLWLALMGIGPMGLAFFTWDYGVKHGDIALLGVLAYIGPLIGISLLILLGFSLFTWTLGLAALLIIGGASLGSAGPMLMRRLKSA